MTVPERLAAPPASGGGTIRLLLRGEGGEVEFRSGAAPELRYALDDPPRTFAGAQVELERTLLGTLAGVTLETVPDLGDLTATLVVPDVNLGGDGRADVETFLVRTRHRTSIGGPALVEGALQVHEVVHLSGTAEAAGAPGDGCRDWVAIHDLEPPGPGFLRVRGRCTVPTPGHRVELRRCEPQGSDPRDLLLERIVHDPVGPVAQVITEVDVEFGEATDAELDTVTVLPDAVAIPVQRVL